MKCVLLQLVISLPGCSSLKEKRGRIAGIREKFGAIKNIALCESAYQDSYVQSEWSFVVVGLASAIVDSTISDIEEGVDEIIDGFIEDVNRESLF